MINQTFTEPARVLNVDHNLRNPQWAIEDRDGYMVLPIGVVKHGTWLAITICEPDREVPAHAFPITVYLRES